MAGKISEYTNSGNIEDYDLLDYSHELEQGTNQWETRSITFAQLKTALQLSATDLPLGKADQTLDANRIVSGDLQYNLTVKDWTQYNLYTDTSANDKYSSNIVNNQERNTVTDSSNNMNVETIHRADQHLTNCFVGTDKILQDITFETGHKIEFPPPIDENAKLVDSIVTTGSKGDEGWFTNSQRQRWLGDDTEPDRDMYWAIEFGGKTIGLPEVGFQQETGLNLQRLGMLWFNSDVITDQHIGARELSYVNEQNKIRRVQNYGQKGYIFKNSADSGTLWYVNCDDTYNYCFQPVASGGSTVLDLTLGFQNVQCGDFGNIIFDLSAISGGAKLNLILPNNSVVVNDGQGAITNAVFVEGEQHSLTWTYVTDGADFNKYYITYGQNYT